MRKPDDAKYREMINQNLDVSMLVEAGAGSGKTTSLVDRMLALIAAGKCGVETMAAVTFTRKAAAELKGRFQVSLEKVLINEKDSTRKARYQKALSRLELLFSGTIHSFCARLLRERPIEAGLDPDFEELEEDENTILRDQCWYEYLEGLHAEGSPLLDKVIKLGLKPETLIGTYRNLALYAEVEAVRRQIKQPDFGEQKKHLTAYLQGASEALPREVPQKGWDGLQTVLRRALLQIRHLSLHSNPDFIKVLTTLDKKGDITQNRWSSSETAKEQKAAFDTFKQEVIAPCLEQWRQYCHFFIMELVLPAVAHFKSVRDKRSKMNFHDLLLKSAELLRDNLEVRAYLQERFTHILVDEFQDTDPVQAEVILYLTGAGPGKKSWHDLTVRPGALFIVGDPKQSIYRFRRADIDTYNEVKRIINASGGMVIPLTANFRSLASVCHWVNPVFAKKFPDRGTKYQAEFEPLEPYRLEKSGGVRRITIEKVDRHKQEEIARCDAERICSWIDWALKGNFKITRTGQENREGKTQLPEPGDFMILLRYRAHLSLYARALEMRGIPYDISGGGAFNESEELLHLLNLLQAVVEPEDQVALIATLRGAFYGVSDDYLYRFKQQGGIFSYLALQDGCRDGEVLKQIGPILDEIREFHRWTRTESPAAALSMILDHLGLIPLALTQEMGESRAGNILKALELSFKEISRGLTTFADIVERLTQYYTELDVEEMAVEPGKKDAVRIMNLHKAKGLEAPVVFLADPLKDVDHDPDLHISRMQGKATGFFVACIQESEFRREIIGVPPDWQSYETLERKYQQAEADRLLYVATTRAKQLLVVSSYPAKPGQGAWRDLYPYLREADELEAPEEEVAIFPENRITPQAVKENRQKVDRRISFCKERSYETETVTATAKAYADTIPFAGNAGQGMSWGRVVHRILEALAKDDTLNLDLMAENLLKEEQRLLSEKKALISTVKAIRSSDLWGRMKKADKALVEVPFSTKAQGREVPTVISGTIDLAFREPGGWVLADYKTDKVDENLDALVAYYRPQVEMYRALWQEMSGEPVKEAGLFFVDGSRWVTV